MRFLGVLSGTSADGIDLGLVNFQDGMELEAFETLPFPETLQHQLQQLPGQHATLPQLSKLQQQLNSAFSEAITRFLKDKPAPIAIGFHGQTLWHAPEYGTSWQLGEPAVIAATTGLPVISHFRQSDLALGGQGAPLAPLFHAVLMQAFPAPWAVVNIGGIANISLKTQDNTLLGWDSGPGNSILDALTQKHFNRPYDPDGMFAAQGKVDTALLETLLQDDYFHQPPPKSTGREQFSLAWLEQHLTSSLSPQDQLATATALTAATIARDLAPFSPKIIKLCGGGAENGYLRAQIQYFLSKFNAQKNFKLKKWGRPPLQRTEAGGQKTEDGRRRSESGGRRTAVMTCDTLGYPADVLEAMLFAWLAKKRWHQEPVDYTSITGANRSGLYGTCFYPA